jgi:kynurenine formamidase
MTEVATSNELLNALHLPREGRLYDLDPGRFPGMPLHPAHPAFMVVGYRSPRGVLLRNDKYTEWLGSNEPNIAWNSDLVIGTVHTGAHIDALSHITCGPDSHWYGPTPADEALGDFGPTKYDATQIPPILTRGVLLDVPAYLGVERLEKQHPITREEFEGTLEKQGTQLRKGDALLVRTGYLGVWPDEEKMQQFSGPGLTLEAAEAAVEAGVIAIAGDTESMEVSPSIDPKHPHPVHQLCLIEAGVYILEMVYCEELSRDRRHEFLFICLPVKITGATGSMVRPVAIV